MYQHLEALYNQLSKNFPKEQCVMYQNQRYMKLNVIEWEEFSDVVSNFTWQTVFKEVALVKFWWVIKNIHHSLKRLLKYFSFSNYISVWDQIFFTHFDRSIFCSQALEGHCTITAIAAQSVSLPNCSPHWRQSHFSTCTCNNVNFLFKVFQWKSTKIHGESERTEHQKYWKKILHDVMW